MERVVLKQENMQEVLEKLGNMVNEKLDVKIFYECPLKKFDEDNIEIDLDASIIESKIIVPLISGVGNGMYYGRDCLYIGYSTIRCESLLLTMITINDTLIFDEDKLYIVKPDKSCITVLLRTSVHL